MWSQDEVTQVLAKLKLLSRIELPFYACTEEGKNRSAMIGGLISSGRGSPQADRVGERAGTGNAQSELPVGGKVGNHPDHLASA
jgi:protein tyrosine/serine phosphatase